MLYAQDQHTTGAHTRLIRIILSKRRADKAPMWIIPRIDDAFGPFWEVIAENECKRCILILIRHMEFFQIDFVSQIEWMRSK